MFALIVTLLITTQLVTCEEVLLNRPQETSPVSVETPVGREKDPRCPLVEVPFNPVHLPHAYDCTKFYRCNWGVPELMKCEPPGTHWSIALNRCDWPQLARCEADLNRDPRCPETEDVSNPVLLPHDYDCTKYYRCSWGVLEVHDCVPAGTHWSVEWNRCEFPEIAQCKDNPLRDPRCPSIEEPFRPVLLPHEYDCTKYYRCHWGIPELFDCRPSGTHFSVALNRCDWPELAQCEQDPKRDPRCPSFEDPNSPRFLPHDYDCTKFFRCNWGIPEQFDCTPVGTHWSVDLNRCDWPELAQCEKNPPVDPRCKSAADPSTPVYLPNEFDCTKFYRCFRGALESFDCTPSGTHWSVALNRCDWPNIARCEKQPPIDPRCPLEEDPNNPVHFPHEHDCEKFYRCNWGVLELFDCMPPGTHWSVRHDWCDWPENANCDLTPATISTTTIRRHEASDRY